MEKKGSPEIFLIIIISLFLSFTYLTYDTAFGTFLATLSVDDEYYFDETIYEFENVTYSFDYWMGMVISAKDGFFVSTDIDLQIADGYVEYTSETIPKDTDITIVLVFMPPARSNGNYFPQTDPIKTEFNGENKYTFSSSPITIRYPVSEPKRLKPVVFANGTIIAGSLEEKTFVDINPAHMLTQIKLTKAVVILTYWIAFFSIIMAIGEIRRLWGEFSKKNQSLNSSSNEYRNNCNNISEEKPEGDLIAEEMQHLRHMETAIIPILVVLTILGFNLYFFGEDYDSFTKTIVSIVFSASIIFSLKHLKDLVLRDTRRRLIDFFIESVFLLTLPMAFILIIILHAILFLLDLPLLSYGGLAIYLIGAFVGGILIKIKLENIIFRRVIPAFETKIFPTLWWKYELYSLKFKTKKSRIKKELEKMNVQKKNIIDHVEGIASTTATDAHGETLTLDELKFLAEEHLKKPFIYLEHDKSLPPVGKAIETGIRKKKNSDIYGLYVNIGIYDKEHLDMIKNGIKKGLSIAYIRSGNDSKK